MAIKGGCYCGALRYEAEAEITVKVACCCRDCQYITGGGPNYVAGIAEDSVRYVEGEPKTIVGKDGDPCREFCGNCGTHIISRPEKLQGMVMLKVGTLDNPGLYSGPDMVVYNCDAQAFHLLPEGVQTFEKLPG